MKVKNLSVYLFLVFHLVFFFYGIITIMQSENKAVALVADTIEDEETLHDAEQNEEAIALYCKEYKRRGIYILILSTLGISSSFSDIYNRKKNIQVKSTKQQNEL